MRRIIWLPMLLLFILPLTAVYAQDEEEIERKDIPPIPEVYIPEISEEELMAIIDRADNFFIDQGIENMAVDLILYRDPGRELTLDDLTSGAVDYKAPLTPIRTHYFYEAPGWYQLKIMGMVVISSDMETSSSWTSMLPLPGGALNIPAITDNYEFTYLGNGEFNGRETHKIRVSAKDFSEQFIKYSVCDFDIEEGYLSRIETNFEGGYYRGHGSGEFYYRERGGKILPAQGSGYIFISPWFHITLWGSWFKWEFNADDFSESVKRGDEDEDFTIALEES